MVNKRDGYDYGFLAEHFFPGMRKASDTIAVCGL